MTNGDRTAVFVDLDSVLVRARRERRGIELSLEADVPTGLARLRDSVDQVVVLVRGLEAVPGMATPSVDERVAMLRNGAGDSVESLVFVECRHAAGTCDCAPPGSGLIERAFDEHAVLRRGGWHISGDQEGVQAGRAAGLRTIRIGPPGEDHLSAVHRADFEARDLLDAANRVLLETLG